MALLAAVPDLAGAARDVLPVPRLPTAAVLAGAAFFAVDFFTAPLAAAAFFIGALAAFFTAVFAPAADLAVDVATFFTVLPAVFAAATDLAAVLPEPPARVFLPTFSGLACSLRAAVVLLCAEARAVLRVDFAIFRFTIVAWRRGVIA